MKYFENFPLINYPTPFQGVSTFMQTVDLSIRFNLLDTVLNTPNAFYEYEWKDDDTPHEVAFHYYGDSYYDWVVMISAEAFDWIYDYPLTDDMLISFIETKYNIDFFDSTNIIHHYEDGDGFVIDLTQYVIEPEPKRIVYIYDYEVEQNLLKRKVKLLSKEYLSQINDELEGKLIQIRNSRELYGIN